MVTATATGPLRATRTRLSAAAALTALTLGLPCTYASAKVWSTAFGLGDNPSGQSDAFLVREAPARVLIVGALVALVIGVAHRRTPATRRVVRAGSVALAGALAMALAEGAMPVVVCLLAALTLIVPLIWRLPTRHLR